MPTYGRPRATPVETKYERENQLPRHRRQTDIRLFKVSDGMITVTAPDGHTRTVDIDESMLCPETLAKMLLLPIASEGATALPLISPSCRSC